jgi:hypothetical protein
LRCCRLSFLRGEVVIKNPNQASFLRIHEATVNKLMLIKDSGFTYRAGGSDIDLVDVRRDNN